MRIGITGATGFLGSHLLNDALAQGHEVRILSRRQLEDDRQYEVIIGDLSNQRALQAFTSDLDVIYHLASLLGKWGLPWEEYEKINVKSTEKLIAQCKTAKNPNLIYISTAGVVGGAREIPVGINAPYSPFTLYERSKMMAEQRLKKEIENGH
jgi:nucleoside-diphosphate-sugar epimerase